MIKSVLQRLISKTGYQICPKTRFDSLMPTARFGYEEENVARTQIMRIRDHSMVAYVSLLSLWQQIRFCELTAIAGDFVECGVWKGGAVGLMALGNLHHSTTPRRLRLFDVFDDICEPDPQVDGTKAVAEFEQFTGRNRDIWTGELAPGVGFYNHLGGAGKLEEVKTLLEEDIGYDSNYCTYHPGWFQHTMPNVEIEKIAILRLDSDWYASTKTCLNELYDKVVPGGFVIIDDYGCYEGCRKAVDEFIETRGLRVFLHHVNADCRYWQVPA